MATFQITRDRFSNLATIVVKSNGRDVSCRHTALTSAEVEMWASMFRSAKMVEIK